MVNLQEYSFMNCSCWIFSQLALPNLHCYNAVAAENKIKMVLQFTRKLLAFLSSVWALADIVLDSVTVYRYHTMCQVLPTSSLLKGKLWENIFAFSESKLDHRLTVVVTVTFRERKYPAPSITSALCSCCCRLCSPLDSSQ